MHDTSAFNYSKKKLEFDLSNLKKTTE